MNSVAKFGNNYFYDLNLNQKFCEGIERAKELGHLEVFYSEPILKVFYYWHSKNCSQSAYNKLLTMIERQKQAAERKPFLLEFQQVFFGNLTSVLSCRNSIHFRITKLFGDECEI